jgi:pimeloyl-ACP methyl ester carboxylesterase
MAVLGIDVTRHGALSGTGGALAAAAALPPGAPVAIMIHGYRYDPAVASASPHATLYAPEPRRRGAISWSKALRLDREGLAVGFGWPARGTLHGAWLRAGAAGAALAAFLPALRDSAPKARIALIGHSLGARVALAALRGARPGDVDAAILLAPAEFRAAAQEAADSPAGRAARIVSVTSRENAVFDQAFAMLVAGGLRPVLGAGLDSPRPHWTDIHLHDDHSLAALAAFGHPVAPPQRRVCHWFAYTRPGVLPLYRALIDGTLPPERLAADLPPAAAARRARRTLALPQRLAAVARSAAAGPFEGSAAKP